jgi:hypothetical protein
MDWHWQQLATARATRQAHVRDTPPARGPTRTGPVLRPSPRPGREVTALGLDSHETSPSGRPTQSGPETGSEFPHPTRAGPAPAGPKHLIGTSSGLDHVDKQPLGHDPKSITGNVHTAHNRGITDETVNCALSSSPHKRTNSHEGPWKNKRSPASPAGSEFFIGIP